MLELEKKMITKKTATLSKKEAANLDFVKTGRIRQINEKKILNAALEVFSRSGFDGATVKQVAEVADLPKANIHYYFQNKTELYAAVLGDVLEEWQAAAAGFQMRLNPAEAIGRYISSRVRFSFENPLASRLIASEISAGAPFLKNHLDQNWVDALLVPVASIQAWVDSGKIDPVDPYALLFLIWGSAQYLADYQFFAGVILGREVSAFDFDAMNQTLAHVVLKGIGLELSQTDMANKLSFQTAEAV
jgi:TetR/AcrR family transcriptional regulator